MLTREHFLHFNAALPTEKVDVPELGGHVYIRTMTAGDRDRFEVQISQTRDNFRARLVAFTACDEKGARVFDEGDIAMLSKLPANVVQPIAEAALRLNRLTAEAVEDLGKGSDASPSDAS